MKHKLYLRTRIKLYFKYLFGSFLYKSTFFKKDTNIPYIKWYNNFEHFISGHKEYYFIKRYGNDFYLSLTIRQIKNFKI